MPFFGSMLNFFRPSAICLSLLECLFSSLLSWAFISDSTSISSSLICCISSNISCFFRRSSISSFCCSGVSSGSGKFSVCCEMLDIVAYELSIVLTIVYAVRWPLRSALPHHR
uniref:Putative secreted protein n=1 Tax=Anopheles darlingi TaxID=43151 RepID=A0A2M4DBY2_ANODA